jgi:dTDP-4-amino-4,6-dideoxygalactose transaminase
VIPFNKPFVSGQELDYIKDVISLGRLSSGGKYSDFCQKFFLTRFPAGKSLLTQSCTVALEMAALLINIRPDDEIIMPSYTFVSTANAFLLRGAKIVFADSSPQTPNMEAAQIERLITGSTKAIVVVHYAGIACDMDPILELVRKYKLLLIEDAAHALDAFYKGKALGSFGDLSAFSFHETKNITAGEAGLLVVNREHDVARAEVLYDKGTNRASFLRGQTENYQWMDIGSSYAPSEVTAAFLYAQLQQLETVTRRRKEMWTYYQERLGVLASKGMFKLPVAPDYAEGNGHICYFMCSGKLERNALIAFLKIRNIQATFHYHSLHSSNYFSAKHDGRNLPNSDRYASCLIRLPMYFDLTREIIDKVCNALDEFYGTLKS